GEITPYLEDLRVLYQPDPPPLPPVQITAIPRDGGVDLSWKASHDTDLTGYLVYYGLKEGNYLGDHALLGASPIDAGKRTSIRIDGLRNGALYYFAVAGYDRVDPYRPGMFSREVTARPLRMLE
ncbi:MAG: fibronectin type III domain-containing protein, partial [Treponema sp.]|nr:fibronectin type III domain-containing protein [Treponema sp.]